jgi:hypothetical protein
MLGRYCQGGCPCRICGDGGEDTRWRKRVEARQLAAEVDAELAPDPREWLAGIPGYDSSDCRHGCNGWPCNSEQCTFVCHEGLPVKTYFDGSYASSSLT